MTPMTAFLSPAVGSLWAAMPVNGFRLPVAGSSFQVVQSPSVPSRRWLHQMRRSFSAKTSGPDAVQVAPATGAPAGMTGRRATWFAVLGGYSCGNWRIPVVRNSD
jgi:hypothetical protein